MNDESVSLLTDETLPDKIINILSDMYKRQCLLETQIGEIVGDNILLQCRLDELEEALHTQNTQTKE